MAEEEVAALVVDNGSGMCKAGFAVTMHLAPYSLRLSAGPRCQASWSVWTRRTVVGDEAQSKRGVL